MKTKLLILTMAILAALGGATPSGAATAIGGGGRADTWAPPPDAGPQEGEVPLGSFVGPAPTRGRSRHGVADSFKGGPGCSIQCITSGVAYGRGPDARLVVTTDTPATITIMVTRSGYSRIITSDPGQTVLEADFDDLAADTHYDAFVSAVDSDGQIANRSGSFTTLQRNVEVWLSHAEVTATPYGNQPFSQQIWFEGVATSESYGEQVVDGQLPLGIIILQAHDTDRNLELAVELSQHEDTDEICQVHQGDELEFGQFHCDYTAWAGFAGGSLDLDDRPGNAGHWNSYEIAADLVVPGPYYSPLQFTVPVAVAVTWT